MDGCKASPIDSLLDGAQQYFAAGEGNKNCSYLTG